MICVRFAGGKEYQDIFSRVIAGLGQFILESPEMFIGQVLLSPIVLC
jgi:hypothetical protein